jgi:ParB family chromosome partitioning protein
LAEKRPALGRGLSALIPDTPAAPVASERALEIDTDRLRPNKFQPRTRMDEAKIEDLARSIRANGIIQPIVARKVDGGYEIIAGERRWRASQRAGLLKVPVVIREIPEERLLAAALIENIQREDLNPIEEAHAYRRLADDFHLTQEQIADAVGKDRSSVANYVRLLRLPHEIRENVAAGSLSMGHARALLALPDEAAQLRAGRDVVSKQLSVRETEVLVKKSLRRMCTRAPRRTSSASRSAPASASFANARAAASKSISRQRMNCTASTSSSRIDHDRGRPRPERGDGLPAGAQPSPEPSAKAGVKPRGARPPSIQE